jgi:multidrug efflux pump subunit AcrA (membrane-fusion protein)
VGDELWPQTTIAEIPDLSQMQVVCKVPEQDIGSIRKGLDVLVHLEERADVTYHGTVGQVGAIATEVEAGDSSGLEAGTRVFDVMINLQGNDAKQILPGMTSTAEIITRRLSDSVFVQKECVFDQSGKQIAFVRKGDRFVEMAVTPGAQNLQFVEIKEGLRPGQQVAKQRPYLPGEGV